jgi:hypothetical protein
MMALEKAMASISQAKLKQRCPVQVPIQSEKVR